MKTKSWSSRSGWLVRLVSLGFTAALIVLSAMPKGASAQSSDDPWATPLNLSHSGAATNPDMVIDSDATMHVIWQDEFANFVYTRFDGSQWSAPQQTLLHLLFGRPPSQDENDRSEEPIYVGPNPLFIASPTRDIYAIWLSPQGSLYASHVHDTDFRKVASWHPAQRISFSAASFAAAVDANGELHVAYFRVAEDISNPAGIYYTHSKRRGLDWSAPVLLYKSPYIRTLETGEANLIVTTAGAPDAPLIYIAWDHRPRKQVFLMKSTDNGASWEPPMQIAGPSSDSALDGPFNIRLSAQEDNILLVWQSGKPDGACSQFYEISGDAGYTWSEAQPMIENLSGCAQSNEFVPVVPPNSTGMVYLLTDIEDQVFLSAWNGHEWSEPQAQPTLASFDDPEIYSNVTYACHRPILSGERLHMVGCDEGGGGDIWVTSRTLEAATSWFTPPLWSQPAPVTSDDIDAASVDLVATADDLLHVVSSQREDSSIYYTRWNGTSWSIFNPVLTLPEGELDWPVITAGPGNELFLLAQSSEKSLYFSRANSSDAVSPASWSKPIRLPVPHNGRVGPADVVWDAAGNIYIVYSVPVNDNRGVYIIHSKDQGANWSAPLQVFDGVAAGYEVVGSPYLQVLPNGSIHILWNKESIQGDGVSLPLALYSAHSEDAAQTFSPAELVVEANVGWRKIASDADGNLHRIWQQLDDTKTLWDQISLDGGRSWQSAERFPAEGGTAAVAVDTAGQLHLVDEGLSALTHWLWEGSRWRVEPLVHWSSVTQIDSPVQLDQMELLAASVNRAGKLVVILAGPSTDDATKRLLLYATRTLSLPSGEIADQDSLAQPPASQSTISTTPSPEVMVTPAITAGEGSADSAGPIDQINDGDAMTTLPRVLLPVAFFLLSVLGIVSIRVVRNRFR